MGFTSKDAKTANSRRTTKASAKKTKYKERSNLGHQAKQLKKIKLQEEQKQTINDDIPESSPSTTSFPLSPYKTRSLTKKMRKKKIITPFEGTSVISNEKYKQLTDYIIDNPLYCDKSSDCNNERARMIGRSSWGGVEYHNYGCPLCGHVFQKFCMANKIIIAKADRDTPLMTFWNSKMVFLQLMTFWNSKMVFLQLMTFWNS
eukprot:172209_1